jgi:hypothetical protein
MSVWGEITIECDTPGCHAQHAVTADEAFRVAGREYAEDEGWIVGDDGQHTCPQCIEWGKAQCERAKGDDDGVEYGDPRDARDERL